MVFVTDLLNDRWKNFLFLFSALFILSPSSPSIAGFDKPLNCRVTLSLLNEWTRIEFPRQFAIQGFDLNTVKSGTLRVSVRRHVEDDIAQMQSSYELQNWRLADKENPAIKLISSDFELEPFGKEVSIISPNGRFSAVRSGLNPSVYVTHRPTDVDWQVKFDFLDEDAEFRREFLKRKDGGEIDDVPIELEIWDSKRLHIEFSPDSSKLMAYNDYGVEIVEIPSGKSLQKIASPNRDLNFAGWFGEDIYAVLENGEVFAFKPDGTATLLGRIATDFSEASQSYSEVTATKAFWNQKPVLILGTRVRNTTRIQIIPNLPSLAPAKEFVLHGKPKITELHSDEAGHLLIKYYYDFDLLNLNHLHPVH
jgi:hypothetical protein